MKKPQRLGYLGFLGLLGLPGLSEGYTGFFGFFGFFAFFSFFAWRDQKNAWQECNQPSLDVASGIFERDTSKRLVAVRQPGIWLDGVFRARIIFAKNQ